MAKELPKTALEYVLRGLIPYTEANIKLAFKPNLFFNDLAKISRSRDATLRTAYNRGRKRGLIELDELGIPKLTARGFHHVQHFEAKHLGLSARLMVIFDIPENESWKRQHLRRLLRELKFKQIQKSVWASEYDYREVLQEEIETLKLQKCVQTYEALRL
ncbi:MAG TPA: hypothetical protein VLG13_01225 [Patescibacteria group bacterium]|nr:hypothetical protein [Patescibacteria group bacterium]